MTLTNLPLTETIETQKVLKKAISANRALAKVARIIQNSVILIKELEMNIVESDL